MHYRTFDIDIDGLENKKSWQSPLSDLKHSVKRKFSIISSSFEPLKSMLLTIMLADDHTLVQLGVIGHTTMLSSMNERVDRKNIGQIRQIIDTSSCLRTAGASFVLLLQVNKYKKLLKFNGNSSSLSASSSSSLIKSMMSLEKQLKGFIDMMVIHDSSIKNISDTNNKLYRLHNDRSSSFISKNNGTMTSTSTMMPMMALRDQLGIINLTRSSISNSNSSSSSSSSSSNEKTTAVVTNIISF